MKRKIVYCLPSLYISGGMERVLTIKANYFADVLGYDIYIILTDGENKPPFYKLSPLIKIINLNINFEELWNKPLLKRIFIYYRKQQIYKQKLKKALFSIRPDITVSMLRREINFINGISDGSIKIGELHVNRENFRNLNEENINNPINILISKIWMKQLVFNLNKLSTFVVLCNEEEKKWPELKNIVVINNPLPFYPEESSDCLSHKVIAVGRLTYQKGFDLLIKAWKSVSDKFPDWKLYIYGNGETEEYDLLIKELRIENSCIIKKSVNNIIEKYCESSIFVLSSRYEGFGMVLIEAMACGIPAVTFTCPSGPSEIIEDGVDGLHVKNGDVNDLSQNICMLIEDKKCRISMGKLAKTNAKRFKIDVISNQWITLFDKITKKKD